MKHFDKGQGAFFMQFQGYKYIKTLGKMPIWALYKVKNSVTFIEFLIKTVTLVFLTKTAKT